DQRRRVPLGEKNRITFGFEPLIEKRELGRLAAAVGALDDEELAGKLMVSVGIHRRLSLFQLCYRSMKRVSNFVPLTTCQIKLEGRLSERLRPPAEGAGPRSRRAVGEETRFRETARCGLDLLSGGARA